MIQQLQEDMRVIKTCREDFKVLFYTLIAAMMLHFVFIFLFYAVGLPTLSTINVVSVIFYIYCTKLFAQSLVKNDFSLLIWLITAEVIMHAYFACYYLGFPSGFQYYILALTAFPLFTTASYFTLGLVRLLLIIVAFIALERWLAVTVPIVDLGINSLDALRYFNLSCFVLLSGGIAFSFVKATHLNQDNLIAMATYDKLTGLNNRYSLEAFTEANVAQSKLNGKPLSMLIADIDFFKEINDKYGHLCGDYVLSKVADVMRGALRSQDVIGRWGGEEFMVILPDTNAETLALLAERLRLTMMQTVFIYNDKKISISVTVGAAMMVDSDTVESLVLRTDQALYQGKDNGRNCYYFKPA